MAYNQDNETRTQLLEIQKDNRGNYLRVAMIQKNGSDNRSLDIREFWTSDNDEILPTKKGVRIKDEQAVEIVKAMLEILEVDELEDVANTIAMKLADGEESEA